MPHRKNLLQAAIDVLNDQPTLELVKEEYGIEAIDFRKSKIENTNMQSVNQDPSSFTDWFFSDKKRANEMLNFTRTIEGFERNGVRLNPQNAKIVNKLTLNKNGH